MVDAHVRPRADAVAAAGADHVEVGAAHDRGQLAATALVAGLAAATVAQGGYHGAGRLVVAVTLVAVVGALTPAAFLRSAVGRARLRGPVTLLTAFAVLAVARGAAVGHPGAGVGWAASALAVVVVLVAVADLTAEATRTVLDGLLGISVVVAVGAWAGVVGHLDRLATDQDAVWRGASTLTYANAACALLVTTALLTLARRTAHPDRTTALVLVVQVVGIGATLSRAGLLAAAVGLAILVGLLGVRPVGSALAAPLLGAVVAVAGLSGSFALDSAAGRPLALAALPLGLVGTGVLAGGRAGAGARPARVRVPAIVVLGTVAAGCLAVALVVPDVVTTVTGTVQARTGTGAVRLEAHRAAWQQLADSPVLGLGPGHPPVPLPGEGLHILRYVHDEYAETALALGLGGLAVLVAALSGLATAGVRARRTAPRADQPLVAAGLAVLAAGCVHAAFDFLWHVPVVPLTVAAVVAAGLRSATTTTTWKETP